jgi:RNA polymerase sigma-70 factor (ECF subfamily)
MSRHDKAAGDRTRRFRELALPHLDDAYTFACFLMQSRSDAEHAVQECYGRALRDFDGWPASAVKPRLLAILRNVCHRQLDRRARPESTREEADGALLLRQPQTSIPSEMLEDGEGAVVRQRVDSLPLEFRELIVLRELNDLSYREIAEVVGVSLGTVATRLAQARRAAARRPELPGAWRRVGYSSDLTGATGLTPQPDRPARSRPAIPPRRAPALPRPWRVPG